MGTNDNLGTGEENTGRSRGSKGDFGTFVTSRKRFVVITRFLILVIVAVLAKYEASPESLRIIYPILAIFGLSNVIFIFQSASKFEIERISGWIFVFDTFFVTVFVFYLRARTTEFYLVYFLTIFIAASAKSSTAAIATSVVTAIIYGVLTKYGKTGVALYSISFFMRTIFFFVTAMVVGYFAEQVKKEREAKEAAQHMLHLTNRLATLFDISQQMVSKTDLDELARYLFDSAVRVLDGESGSLMLFDEATDTLTVKESTGLSPMARKELIRVGERVAGVVARDGEAVLLEGDIASDPRFRDTIAHRRIPSAVCAPLMIGQRVLGVLNVNRGADSPAFTESDLELLVALANHAAIVLEKAKLYEQLSVAYDASRLRYETLVNTANAMIFATNADGAVTFVNEHGAEMLGRPADELEGTPFFDLLHPDDVEKFRETLETVTAHRQSLTHLEYRVRRPNSEEWSRHSASCAPLENKEKGEYGLLGVAEDITEYVLLQKHVSQTAKLASIGTMISGVAHELNNPLTGVIGYAGLLRERSDVRGLVGRELDMILRQADRCAEIVRGLLRFARQEEAIKRPVDLNKLLKESLDLRRHEMAVQNITIHEEYARDLPLTAADPSQIQQVLLNIIGNAFDAMTAKQKPGMLSVRTYREDGILSVELADEGGGIADIDKIFDPFYTTKEVGKGTGLGLSISYGIVEEHGGRIEARNSDMGAVFVVTLPIVEAPPEEEPEAPTEQAPAGELSILVIDDEEIILQLSRDMLGVMGHEVTTAMDAAKGLDELRANHYDVILTDIRMPGSMDGRSLYNWIKENRPESLDRVVFTTGDMLSPDVRAFIRQTGAECLAKPFHLNDLQQTIERVTGSAAE